MDIDRKVEEMMKEKEAMDARDVVENAVNAIEEAKQVMRRYSPVQRYCGVRFGQKTAKAMLNAQGKSIKDTISLDTDWTTDTIYTFKYDMNLEVGDTVVCDCTNGLSVGVVVKIDMHDTNGSGISTRWIVQKVDLEVHKERIAKDNKRKAIRCKMDDRRKQLEDEALYRMMAERDPEMARLIEEYYA